MLNLGKDSVNQSSNQEPTEPAPPVSGEPPLAFWARLVRGPVLITTTTSVFTFLGTILLFRHLSEGSAGVLTLMLALIQLGLMLSGLGQPTLIQRVYSHGQGADFNWPHDLLLTTALGLPVTGLLGLASFVFYNLAPGYILIGSMLVMTQLVIYVESRILNAIRHYTWASVLMRLPNSLLVLPAIALIVFDLEHQLDITLLVYAGATLVVAILGMLILKAFVPRGTRTISWSERRSGLVFLLTYSSYTLPDQGLLALGGGLLPSTQLAIYGAMAPLLKPFDLMTDVLRNIFTTEFIHLRQKRLNRMLAGLWSLSILAAVMAAGAGPIVTDWLYSGRYTAGNSLIPWLAAAGLFRLLEVVPRSHIIGQSSQSTLRRFVLWQSAAGILLLAGGVFLVSKYGVLAVAIAMMGLQAMRFVITQIFYRAETNS